MHTNVGQCDNEVAPASGAPTNPQLPTRFQQICDDLDAQTEELLRQKVEELRTKINLDIEEAVRGLDGAVANFGR